MLRTLIKVAGEIISPGSPANFGINLKKGIVNVNNVSTVPSAGERGFRVVQEWEWIVDNFTQTKKPLRS